MSPASGQEALVALQDIDTSIDQRRHRRVNLAERAQLAEIEQLALAARTELDGAAAGRAAMAGHQAGLEADLAATEERMAAVRARLAGGEVGAARELSALTESLDHLGKRASDLEDAVLAAMDEIAPLDHRVEKLRSEIVGLAGRHRALTRGLQQAEAGVDAEIADLQSRRSLATAGVDPAQHTYYEQLRRRLGGVAVARLAGSRCDGCHLTLPATEMDRIRHLGPDEVLHCDHCWRFLVRP
ncbi:MAG: zinc ribbon domain-containing protein [Acidimicrobiales bacterium]